jgi:sugar phosphate permease
MNLSSGQKVNRVLFGINVIVDLIVSRHVENDRNRFAAMFHQYIDGSLFTGLLADNAFKGKPSPDFVNFDALLLATFCPLTVNPVGSNTFLERLALLTV